MITLTRRYRFAASHRLHVPGMTEEENIALFGKCNNPFGHGHDYVLSVTVAGEIDETTGLLIRTQTLDRMIEEKILRKFAHRNMNLDLPEFAAQVPTTENIALVIAGILETEWPAWFKSEPGAQLWKIHVDETDRNGFEVLVGARKTKPVPVKSHERVSVHA